jgi:hypothetical protein
MPKSKHYAGRPMDSHVMNSAGVWVRSKFAGMRIGKNTRVSDYQDLAAGRKKRTHTSPVIRTKANSGMHLKCNKSYLKAEMKRQREAEYSAA